MADQSEKVELRESQSGFPPMPGILVRDAYYGGNFLVTTLATPVVEQLGSFTIVSCLNGSETAAPLQPKVLAKMGQLVTSEHPDLPQDVQAMVSTPEWDPYVDAWKAAGFIVAADSDPKVGIVRLEFRPSKPTVVYDA